MKKILIFGGTSFVGTHFQNSYKNTYKIESYGREVDVRNKDRLLDKIKTCSPHIVINMASVPTIRDSFEDSQLAYKVSFYGTDNILSSLHETGFKGQFLYVSSSEVYGNTSPDQGTFTESMSASPESPYAVAKLAAESLCKYYSKRGQFSINIVRPFNHIGPGQTERFAISNFAKQLVEIDFGMRDSFIEVGNLHVYRDFTDVRDVVEAYRLIVESEKTGEVYNVCRGRSFSLKDMLYSLIEVVGINPEVKVKQSLSRNNERLQIQGSPDLIHADLGWKPMIPLDQTVNDIIEYWKAILGK